MLKVHGHDTGVVRSHARSLALIEDDTRHLSTTFLSDRLLAENVRHKLHILCGIRSTDRVRSVRDRDAIWSSGFIVDQCIVIIWLIAVICKNGPGWSSCRTSVGCLESLVHIGKRILAWKQSVGAELISENCIHFTSWIEACIWLVSLIWRIPWRF